MSVISRILSILIVIAVIVVICTTGQRYAISRMLGTDYSTEPPYRVFKEVVGFSPPRGITGIKVAGHGGGKTHLLWMKLRGTEDGLASLTKSFSTVDPKGFHYSMPQSVFGIQKTFYDDASAAGWDDVPNIKHPEYFMFTSKAGNGWNGELVVDRAKHVAYMSALQ